MKIEDRRPLMQYAAYNSSWITVEIVDRFSGQWCWGEGPYYDWCDANCVEFYNIVKYNRNTIHGRFKNAKDATAFALRWL